MLSRNSATISRFLTHSKEKIPPLLQNRKGFSRGKLFERNEYRMFDEK
jgi:hypothetical protein